MRKRHDHYFVYIVQCRDGSYYTGYTQNLDKRIRAHNDGTGSKYLRGKLPVKLVYSKEYYYYKNALKAERAVKRLTRIQKEEFIKVYNMVPTVSQSETKRGDAHV